MTERLPRYYPDFGYIRAIEVEPKSVVVVCPVSGSRFQATIRGAEKTPQATNPRIDITPERAPKRRFIGAGTSVLVLNRPQS